MDDLKMKIAIIGSGNVGGALAKGFSKAGYQIYLGVRNIDDPKVKALVNKEISAHTISEAVSEANIIIMVVRPPAVKEIAQKIGDVSGKIIIDAMNTFEADLEGAKTTAEAFLKWTNCKNIVKCFNTTGANNMENPEYKEGRVDMFIAGDSKKGKEIASTLAKDIGFGSVYDLGGNDKFELIEQLAIVWIDLAMKQGYGRNIGFKILK